MIDLVAIVPLGILLPNSALRSELFGVLAAFVAFNTVIYVALAVTKMLPKLYLSDWVPRRARRWETRSIHPEEHPPTLS
ncbi:MAG: hypothetical protein WKF79_13175 [Nocardioides sp.]